MEQRKPAANAQKGAQAQAQKQSAPENTEPKGKTYTEEEVRALVAEAAKKAAEEALASVQTAQSAQSDGMVTVLYMAEVSPDNMLTLPGYGSMRPNSSLDIPKKEFGGKFMSPLARKLIEKRHLIVVDGLTEDERRRWDCDYKAGEVLDERAFDRLLDYDLDKLEKIFKLLCPEHKRFVARRFISASERGDNRVGFDKVKLLNDISKATDPEGMFKPIIEKYKESID